MTNKFFSSVDGNHSRVASVMHRCCHRSDSVSFMSGQSLLPILLLCLTLFIGIGNVWGADPTKTETFESATVSTTYNSTKTITTSQSSCGIEWSIYYGSPSTTQAITGTKSCLIRYYTADAKLGYAKTTTAIKGLKNVTFNAKVTNTGNKMGVWYSTDGNTWTSIASDVVLTTSSQSKSYDIPSSSVSTDYYIKIGLTTGCSTNKKDLIIDDVVFTYASNTPSYTITAQTNNNSLGLVSKSGSVITGTPSTCCEYASPAYTVSPEGKATVTQGTGNKINEFTVSSLTDDVTVTINFQAKNPGKTVKFDAGAGNYTGGDLTEDCVGSGITLPSATATSICKGWTTFAGWATSAVTDSSTTEVTICSSPYVPNTNNQILYAVYSKDKSGASSTETIAAADLGVSNSTAIGTKTVGTITIKGEQGNNGTSTNVPKYYSAESSIRCYASNDLTISSTNTISQIDFTYDGSYNGGTITPNSGAWASTATTNWDQTWQGSTTSVKFRVGNSQWRVTNIKVTTGGGSTTYYVSDPNCCTPLGTIKGSISWTNGTSATLTWNDMSNVASETPYVVSFKKGSGNYTTSGVGSITTSAGKKTCSVTVDEAGAAYTFKLEITGDASHCPKDTTMTATAPKITATADLGDFGYAQGSNPEEQSFTVSGTALTGNLTVTAPANYLIKVGTGEWSSAGGNKSITVSTPPSNLSSTTIYVKAAIGLNEGDNPSGNIRISGGGAANVDVPVSATITSACAVDPTIGAATLKAGGAFGLDGVAVSVTGMNPGTNCTWTDYGFYWGTVDNKKAHKVEIGNSGNATSFEATLAFEAPAKFAAGTTYYFCAYGKNAKSGAEIQCGTEASFTPYTVSYNKNDDDATGSVTTQVVNAGGSVTLPSASAYTLGCNDLTKWALNSASGTQYDPEDTYSSINANAEFYAIWNKRTYTVQYAAGSVPANGGAITGSHENDTKTCGKDLTLPGVTFYSTGYTQIGWAKSDGGSHSNNLSGKYTSDKEQTFYPEWQINTYEVLKGSKTGCSGNDFDLSAATVDHYGSITVTATADAAHKGSPIVTIFPEGNGSVSGTTISNIIGNITVSVSFDAKEAATVKLSIACSESVVVSDGLEGDSYTLPSEAAECPDLGLYGWYKGTYSHATTAPSGDNYKSKGQTVTLTAGENKFYAVYATVGAPTNTYTKITTTGELESGDYLLIGYFSANYIEAMQNSVSVSDYMTEVNLKEKVNNTTTPTIVTLDSDNSAIRWKITKSPSSITIYNEAISKYFCGSTGTPALNTTSEDFSYSVDGGNWTLVTNGKTVYYSNNWYVGTPSNAKPIYLFKRNTSLAGPYTTDPNCTTHELSYEDPGTEGTIVLGKTVLGEGKTTTATATPSEHYTFSHWTISGTGAGLSNVDGEGKSTDNPVTVTMGTADAVLTAHFTEKEKCTVEFYNNGGSALSSTTYWLGETPEAPTLTDGHDHDACDENSTVHYGWTQTAWTETLTKTQVDAKTAANVKVYTKAEGVPAIVAGDNGKTLKYHAVWAQETTTKTAGKVIDYNGSGKSTLQAITGVTVYGLGGDYANTHSPNVLKFDNSGDYIQFDLDYAPTSLSFTYKKIAGGGASSMIIQECATSDGDYSNVETLALSGEQNATGTKTTSQSFSQKYIRMYFNKEDNVGVGTIVIQGYTGSTTYSAFLTNCCETLSAINVANITVSDITRTSATVSWPKVANATGYEYKLGDGNWTTASIADANNPSISLNLSGATSYTLYLRAKGDGDTYCTDGAASEGKTFKTLSRVSAAVNDALMGTAKVSLTSGSGWADYVDAADGTTIYLQATPGELYDFSNWATPASGTISEGQLTGWSGDVTVTANFVAKELTKLGTPTGMGLVGEPGATSATIKWNAVDHASGYEVVCTGATKGDITVTDGVASCPLTILTAGTTYNWTVKALGDDISFKDGDACAIQNFTTDLKKPTAIEITHAPTLTEYLEGQSFATAGMVVKVTYNNGDIDGAYTGYSIDPSGALTFGMTSVTVTATENGQSRSTTQAITVHKKYTLTFKNNGSIVETRDLKEGDAYGAFPNEGDACDGTSTTFMGWSTAEISEKQAAAPAAGYASPTDVMGTSNVVLNAVWAKANGSERYDLVSTLTANKTYIFVSSNAAGSASALNATGISTDTGSGVKAPATSVTISSGTPVYISTLNTNLEFAYDGTDFQIVGTLAADVDWKYLYINGNGISRRTDKRAYWDDDKGVYGHTNKAPYTYHYIYLNGSEFDRTTSPTSTNRVYAFEKQEVSYTDYLTTCCDEWSVTASYGTGNVISVSDGAVAVDIEGTAYGAASYESNKTDVLTVAANGAITGVKAGSAIVTIAWAGIPGSKCAFETSVDVTVNGPITVTYNKNDGSLEPATKTHSGTISSNSPFALEANTFSRTGYTFQGWATTPSGAKAYDNSQANVSFVEDVTLYAVWALNSHAVTLTQPEGNEIQANSSTTPGNVTYGTSVTLTATENDGYVFTGWSVTGITLADATANPAQFTMPDNAVSVSANYTHYTWDLTGYTVETAPETEYSTGDHFSKASVVIQAGYERSDTKETKQVAVAAANWTAKLSGTEIADNYTFVIGDHDKTLTLWVGDTQVGENYVLTVNAIPTDHFVINIWTNEVSPIADKTIAYSMPSLSDQTAGEAATCKDHNLFVGWVEADYKDEPEGHIVAANTAMTPSDKTFYAVWGKSGTITESISYGWETGESTAGWMIKGSSVATPVHTGEKAGQFGTAGRAIMTSTSYANPKSITVYYAKNSGNTNNENYFKIQYSTANEDNGTWNDIISGKNFSQMSNEYYEELTADLSSSTYEGKYFRVYFNNASTSGNLDDITLNYNISGAVDYITECVQRYQITFDANGGIGSYDAIEKKEGATVTLPDGSALSRAAEHYHFNGWKVYYTSTDVEIPVSNNQFTMPGSAVDAVAQWEEDPKGTVYYVGDNIMDTHVSRYAGQTYDLRKEVTLPSSNMKLVGWMLEGDETLYAPGRTMTMPDPVQDYTYHVQIIDQLHKPSGVNFNDGEWILVTDENQLSAGDYVVIVANGLTNAMGAQGTTNRGVAGVTKNNDGTKITLTENVAKLFLQYGYVDGEFALYDMTEGGYLYANSNSANQVKTTADYSNRNYSWKITIGDGNIASIVAQGDNTHNDLKYNPNNGSPLFSCYTSGMTAVQLYRYEGHKTVEITDDVNASAIYLDDADIVVKDGKTLTIDEASDLDNLTVEAGGKVSGSANLTVNNLTINSEAGKSGQVTGSNVSVNGDIYLDIKLLDGTGLMTTEESQEWYCISAPFEVNMKGGFFWGDGTPMGHNVDFQAFIYDGAKRASTGTTGWQRAGGKLEAGKAYLIGFDDEKENQKTIRLKAMSKNIPTAGQITIEANDADEYNKNWNGVGNPTLHYIALNGAPEKVQCYDNNSFGYNPYDPATHNYVVGTALFMQAENNINLANPENTYFRAPKRESEENEQYSFCVEIAKEGATRCDNRLYVSASDEATSSYEPGKDMLAMNGTSSKFGALIWTENYGMRLASEDIPMVNQKATYSLGVFAPKDGTYSISTVEASEDATLYLTYNDRAIWNLSMSACEVELTKGLNEGYGLKLVAKMPQTPTSIDEVGSDQSSAVQKVVLDEKVFILRGGKMYGIDGKIVK